jgi:hypothetical protein
MTKKAKAIALLLESIANPAKGNDLVKEAILLIKNESEKDTKDFLKDLEGQVTEAFSRQDWLNRWGLHYLRSLGNAHTHSVSINFKDPGVQHYGGKLFEQLRDKFEKIFLTIEPPKPSGYSVAYQQANPNLAGMSFAAAPVQMNSYYNCNNVCWTGNSKIALSNGNWCSIDKIKKGDKVLTGANGRSASILCVLKTVLKGKHAQIVRIRNVGITPWHPMTDKNGKWQFPADVSHQKGTETCALYNLVLEKDHVVLLGDANNHFYSCTLAHGNMQDPVLRHEYFATTKVLEDLQKFSGWKNGYIEIEPSCIKRDPASGLIVSISSR